MKKFRERFYKCLSSVVVFVALTSIVEVCSFCILIIHQPVIPERLKEMARLRNK